MWYLKITISFFMLILLSTASTAQNSKTQLSLNLGGNAFSSFHIDGSTTITNNGIENWTNPEEYFTAYFRISEAGNFKIAIEESFLLEGKAVLEFTINEESKKVIFDETIQKEVVVGNWKISDTGYVALKIKGINKTARNFPSISSLRISSDDFKGKIALVPNNEGNYYHWGRRGPSVHLNYEVPENVNAEWYYNELIVEKGNDIVGSYFMAIGFKEGYFGIQVNSNLERRILFSVWSPFQTDDPESIPESYKIKMLRKGSEVSSGEFGNEGSGGQSYMKYNWLAGSTYKFLVHGVPQKDNTTIYSAYFFAPEINHWQLIASFSRPMTTTYLKHFHSFLENFIPEQGNLTRRGLFNNQWISDSKGNWFEINRSEFTIDATAAKGYRMDYSGGVDKNSFYLKNGGFFNDYVKARSHFTRALNHQKPTVNFDELP